jgi:hypothetical protein
MARIRTIKPEFPQSESMGRVSRDARLCFVLMWTIADDAGRLRGASRMLASLLYPYDDDAPSLMDKWLEELEAEGCIVRYDVGGSRYLQITKWLDHQKIDRPSKSKIPDAPEDSRILARVREPSLTEQDQDLGPVPGPKDQTTAPVGQDDIDQIRMAVWRQAGQTEDQIATKLVSMNAEGIRYARTWLESHPLQTVLDAIAEAYDSAEKRGEAIRKPWPYLDQVVGGIAERKAQEAAAPAVRDKWKDRRALFEAGMWPPSWGAQPGQTGCDAPQWVQEIYLNAKKGEAA